MGGSPQSHVVDPRPGQAARPVPPPRRPRPAGARPDARQRHEVQRPDRCSRPTPASRATDISFADRIAPPDRLSARRDVMKFSFSSGQRPLDGFTIKRGVGKGGFGEVYFAVSDGGKEVALKLVRGGDSQIELRGVAQCLNLKHPNLVSLYDLRTDAEGNHWVVMEYVAGEPLNVVLAAPPRRPAARAGPRVVPGPGPGGRLPARPRHRPPRPQAGQRLPRERHGQGRRLRPVASRSAPASAPPRRSRSAPSTTWPRRSRPATTTSRSTSTPPASSSTRCSPAGCRSTARAPARSS